MAGTSITFDILANDRASSKFAALGHSVDSSASHLSKFRSVASAAAKATLLAGVAATGLAVKLGVDAVKAASDLSETLNKSRVIFGKHADGMEAWAGRADQSMGLSKQAALEAAASFGDMFGQIGFSGNQATAMSRSVVQLSADLGSFNNLDTADVAERMSAAFRGEYDSLQALIPNINAARVEQVALAKTGKTATSELTAQEKAAAVLAIVHKDGARAVGDFARTSDGLANRSKILKAELSNLQSEIGAKLLPVVTDVAGVLLDKGVPALEKFGDKAGPVFESIVDGAGEIKDAVMPAVDEIVEAFGHMVEGGGGVGDMFHDDLLPAISTAADVIGGLVNFIDELPGPVKHLGAEAGIAAIAFSLLSGGVAKASGAMAGLVGPAATAETRLASLKGAASTAAGIGGMLLLVRSSNEANDALKTLDRTAGGALTGFAVGGPIGAAVGTTVGLATSFHDLQNAFEDVLGVEDTYRDEMASVKEQDILAAAAADRHRDAVEQLRATLEAGRNTAASLEPVYANVVAQLEGAGISASTADRQWKLLGISQRTVAQASLGNEAALRAINKAYRSAPLKDRIINEHTLADAIDNSRAANREAIRLERQRLRLTQEWGGKLKALPKEARTAIRLDGVQPTLRGVAKIAEKYALTPKQIKTILEVTGVDATVADVKKAQGELDKTDKKRPKPQVSLSGMPLFNQQLNSANSQLVNLDGDRADTWIYTHHVDVYGGRNGNVDAPPPRGRLSVDPRLGINPRGTVPLMFGKGGSNAFRGIGAGIIRAFAQGINGNASEAERAVDKMMAAIAKALKDKDITEAAAKRMRETVQAMAREADKGRSMLAKRADFASTLRESFASELNLGELVSSETFGGIGDLQGNMQSLATRLRAFAGQLKELRQAGIPRSLIGEIASLGSDQGSKAAAAILSGSRSDRNALSSAYNQLQNAAGLAGNAAANAMYGTVGQIKNEFHININAGMGANGREIGRELEQALTKWAREQGRPLNFPTS